MDSMYAYIKGELAEKNIDSIVVEAAGVGYLIYIPTQYFDMLPDEGEDVKIYTYLCVREDAMILYGFLSKDDLEIFMSSSCNCVEITLFTFCSPFLF